MPLDANRAFGPITIDRKYRLPEKIQAVMCLAIGHPAVKLRRSIRRRFVEVRSVA